MPRYSIRKNRLKSGSVTGFIQNENGVLCVDPSSMYHIILLKGIDSTQKAAEWGRISFKAEGSEDAIYSLYVLAIDNPEKAGYTDRYLTNEEIPAPERLSFLKKQGARRFLKTQDCLVYDLEGRYLYIALEATTEEELLISQMVVDSTGDNFMNTFPQVYQERGSFFHRYISIYSSIYNDFQREIDSLYEILDLDTCPEELLIIYGSWLGINLRAGLFPIEITRKLVKEAYSLNRMKGTREAVERVLTIILGEKPVIVEHNQVRDAKNEGGSRAPIQFKIRSMFDVTILIKRNLTEELRHQIYFMLEQFRPVRARFSIAQMDDKPTADSNSYLDVNTVLPGSRKTGRLNENASLDGAVTLQ